MQRNSWLGWDRLGMVHEARGDTRQAADCYRKVIDFIRQHPDDYDALPPKADTRRREWHVRFVPIGDIVTRSVCT
jgi:hypothetical protein